MRSGIVALVAVTAICAGVLTGCSSEEAPVAAPSPSSTPTAVPTYDGDLEPAAAVMALVPSGATALAVTDYDHVRLQLGLAGLTSGSPADQRARFWRLAERRAPLLGAGLLHDDDPQLLADYGFTMDDVRWQAYFRGPDVSGWVLAFRDGAPMGRVANAVLDGAGPLADADVDQGRGLVTMNATNDPADSWAADPALTALVGPEASATYVATTCVGFDEVFGDGVEAELAPEPRSLLESVDELGPFSVAIGSTLATARLGVTRSDAFDRASLVDVLPSTTPPFGEAFADGVADPQGGRIGFRLVDAATAASLVLDRRLPFAVCGA